MSTYNVVMAVLTLDCQHFLFRERVVAFCGQVAHVSHAPRAACVSPNRLHCTINTQKGIFYSHVKREVLFNCDKGDPHLQRFFKIKQELIMERVFAGHEQTYYHSCNLHKCTRPHYACNTHRETHTYKHPFYY